jgi:hypothetical protein
VKVAHHVTVKLGYAKFSMASPLNPWMNPNTLLAAALSPATILFGRASIADGVDGVSTMTSAQSSPNGNAQSVKQ